MAIFIMRSLRYPNLLATSRGSVDSGFIRSGIPPVVVPTIYIRRRSSTYGSFCGGSSSIPSNQNHGDNFQKGRGTCRRTTSAHSNIPNPAPQASSLITSAVMSAHNCNISTELPRILLTPATNLASANCSMVLKRPSWKPRASSRFRVLCSACQRILGTATRDTKPSVHAHECPCWGASNSTSDRDTV